MDMGHLGACAIIGLVAISAIIHGMDGNVAYLAIIGISGVAGFDLRRKQNGS